MIKQTIEERKHYKVDEGTMGFSDWATKYESLEEFVNRITQKYNEMNIKVINISYPNDTLAIVVYKEK
jgi:dihydroorotate dehydrogenase